MDNSSTHKTKLIRDWFAKRPHWRMHFTPTTSSWINQVERFFALLTEKQIRRGVHRSTGALEAVINACIDATNAEPSRSAGQVPPMISSSPSIASANVPSTSIIQLSRKLQN
jgi:hypothetical protein